MSSILDGLKTSLIGREIVYRESCVSTNTLAARLAEAGAAHGTLVVANAQTAGRGQRGRSWYSPSDASIYMSLILRPQELLQEPAALTLVAAAAVARAFERAAGVIPQIKWPNDILIDGRKCCGILTETRIKRGRPCFFIVGIGVNVNVQPGDFPPELRSIVTSLLAASGHAFSRSEVIQAILEEFEPLYSRFAAEGFGSVRDIWLSYCNTIGKPVQAVYQGQQVAGTAVDVTCDGKLKVRTQAGAEITLTSADILLKQAPGHQHEPHGRH